MPRNYPALYLGLLLTLGGLEISSVLSASPPAGQQAVPAQSIEIVPSVIKSESKIVVLEVVATDKKGRPVTDLQQNDLRVFDGDQEESILSFSRESEAQSAAPLQQRYMVLFFDDTNMNQDIERSARASAAKFAEGTVSPHRLVAVVNFGGTLQVTQDFTANPSLVESAVTQAKFAGVRGGLPTSIQRGGRGAAILTGTEGVYDASSVLLALREVAKSLTATPGRKSMVLFSPGFILLPDRQGELTATIDILNKANIAVYSVDVSGVTNSASSAESNTLTSPTGRAMPTPSGPDMGSQDSSAAHLPANQLLLSVLAKGTGGFEIQNSNNFLKELDKVKQEMDEYYSLSYNPPDRVRDGSYHTVKIKVERHGVELRYRSGYYDTKSPDILLGTPDGKALEARLDNPGAGEIPISVLTPYFYPEPRVAGVDLALSVPGSSISFEKSKGEYHAEVQVLGIVYRTNGSVGGRFSDSVKLDYDKKKMEAFTEGPFTYRNTFKIAPGMYTLKLALNSGGKFAKFETPFYVQPFNGSQLTLAGPALGDRIGTVTQLAANMNSALMEDRHQLIFNSVELMPSATYKFAKTSQPVVYVRSTTQSLRPTTLQGWACNSKSLTKRPIWGHSSRRLCPSPISSAPAIPWSPSPLNCPSHNFRRVTTGWKSSLLRKVARHHPCVAPISQLSNRRSKPYELRVQPG